MKKNQLIIIACFINFAVIAGNTNFVESLNTMWKTYNASNILEFVEINVVTNRSPETLFARGAMAIFLQEWGVGGTNLWEQSINLIQTNTSYSAIGRTNVINEINWYKNVFAAIIDDHGSQISWETNNHTVFFTEFWDGMPLYDTLKNITEIETAD